METAGEANIKVFHSRRRLLFTYIRWISVLKLRKLLIRRDRWVLSRTACLGNDAFSLLPSHSKLFRFNMQKVRSDVLLGGSQRKYRAIRLTKFINRPDIAPLIWAQFQLNIYNKPRPAFILFDSFSDLTDIQFKDIKTKANFACHKSDLTDQAIFRGRLSNLGLLPLEGLMPLYEEIFQKFQEVWAGVQIIYIHYPILFEKRPYLIKRAADIELVIDFLSDINPDLHSIKVPNELVSPKVLPDGNLSSFPYHYSCETSNYVSQQIKSILNRNIPTL
jgi:hypothetical protein